MTFHLICIYFYVYLPLRLLSLNFSKFFIDESSLMSICKKSQLLLVIICDLANGFSLGQSSVLAKNTTMSLLNISWLTVGSAWLSSEVQLLTNSKNMDWISNSGSWPHVFIFPRSCKQNSVQVYMLFFWLRDHIQKVYDSTSVTNNVEIDAEPRTEASKVPIFLKVLLIFSHSVLINEAFFRWKYIII